MGKIMPTPPKFKDLDQEDPELWEIYTNHGKGFNAHIQAKSAKEAIEKFEKKYRDEWIDKPYSVLSVKYLGTLTK